jgi:hypothetical protein
LTFKAMVIATILELHQASIQDGGRCSDTKMATSQTRRVRSLPLTEDLTTRTETSSWNKEMARSTKDGESSTLMSTRKSQLKDNSTRNSVFMLRETSTLFQLSLMEDILT